MPTLPGYNYLGPGNDPYTSGDPVDSADNIAQIHDWDYVLGQLPGDVRRADRLAIRSFWNDFKKTGKVADVLGFAGLSAKYGLESIFGVQYPQMRGDSNQVPNWGSFLYAERERHLADVYRQTQDSHKFPTYKAWKSSNYSSSERSRFNIGGDIYVTLRKHYSDSYGDKQVATKRNSAAASNQLDSGAGPSKRPAFQEQSPSLSPDTNAAIDSFLAGPSPATPDYDTFPDTGSTQGSDTAAIPMDATVDGSGSGRGPTGGSRQGATGASGSAGTASGTGGITWIAPSIPTPPCSITLQKSRIMFSYGYSTANIQLGSPDYIEKITTSLALIPVDFLPFYITHAEWEALPPGATIKRVWANVTPLGTRTAFDTGTTLSGTATSEYVPIGIVGKGLNVQYYGKNQLYNVDTKEPMIPTGTTGINATEMSNRWYNHISSNTMCIPTAMNEYWIHEYNRSANPNASSLPQYIIHNRGVPRMDTSCHQFLVNGAIGQVIADYEYSPKCGIIKTQKDHFVPYNRSGNELEYTHSVPCSRPLAFFTDGLTPPGPAIGDVGLSDKRSLPTMINQTGESYNRSIETYGGMNAQTTISDYRVQPQLHVGLVATPQLKPGSAATSYLNSSCYWKVECGIEIQFDINSAFSKNAAVSWPTEVIFIPNGIPKYTDGQSLFGNCDTGSGNVSVDVSVSANQTDISDTGITTNTPQSKTLTKRKHVTSNDGRNAKKQSSTIDFGSSDEGEMIFIDRRTNKLKL